MPWKINAGGTVRDAMTQVDRLPVPKDAAEEAHFNRARQLIVTQLSVIAPQDRQVAVRASGNGLASMMVEVKLVAAKDEAAPVVEVPTKLSVGQPKTVTAAAAPKGRRKVPTAKK